MNYYNRWPSPSLPPTLKKVSKTENKGLHLDAGDYDLDDGSKGVTIIAPSDDEDSEIRFQSVSSSNNNNNNNHKRRKFSASNGTLDRIDLGMNRQGILDSMSLNSVPVIVNQNRSKNNLNKSTNNMSRSGSKYEHREQPARPHDSFR
jgi:hypothetical protein